MRHFRILFMALIGALFSVTVLIAGLSAPAAAAGCKKPGVLYAYPLHPFSTAWYCSNNKRTARSQARAKWRAGVKARWGGEYSSWPRATRKRIQCRRTPPRVGTGPGPCRYGTSGRWQCRAMACARRHR